LHSAAAQQKTFLCRMNVKGKAMIAGKSNRGGELGGLNQLTAAGALALTYDARGNLTASGTSAYTHTSENFLNSVPGGATLAYDPFGRLYQTSMGSTATTTRCLVACGHPPDGPVSSI
jgi:hypothetical protein